MTIDILLANPLFLNQDEAEREMMTPYFPLGLLYLASYLRERGFSVEIFDGTFAEGQAAFVETLDRHQPRLVGLTSLQPTRETALSLAHLAHQFGATVVLGGPDPTRYPEAYLADPSVDIVVHHEGEETLVELLGLRLAEADPSAVRGLAYRDEEGQVVITPPRPYIADLDSLPEPARDLVDVDRYLEVWREENGYASLSISVARGCPYGCEWCQDAVHGPELRLRSPESVAAEMKMLKETYQVDRLRVVDDVDGLSREWLESWAESAQAEEAVIPFEALYDLERKDIPMLDVRDTL